MYSPTTSHTKKVNDMTIAAETFCRRPNLNAIVAVKVYRFFSRVVIRRTGRYLEKVKITCFSSPCFFCNVQKLGQKSSQFKVWISFSQTQFMHGHGRKAIICDRWTVRSQSCDIGKRKALHPPEKVYVNHLVPYGTILGGGFGRSRSLGKTQALWMRERGGG